MNVSSIGAYSGLSPFALGGFALTTQPAAARPVASVDESSEDIRRSVRDTAQMIVDKLTGRATVGENGGRNGDSLAESLASTADWMSEQHGEQAGRAFLGIIAGYVGSGEVGEEALSKGMLAAIRFTDRTFGIASGDALASRLNADLNTQVNSYFDNGLSEDIYTSTLPPSAFSQTVSTAVSGIAERFGPDEAAAAESMLLDSLKSGSGLREGLKEMLTHFEEKYGLEGDLAGLGETAGTALVQGGSTTPAPKGALLDISA